MRKIIFGVVVGLVMMSCASGWKCNKRYCEVSKKESCLTREV